MSDISPLVVGLWIGLGILQLGREADSVIEVLKGGAAIYQSVLNDIYILFTIVSLFLLSEYASRKKMREQNKISELLTEKKIQKRSKIPKIININKWFSVVAIEQKLNKKNRTFEK